jgi:hypothetical protein
MREQFQLAIPFILFTFTSTAFALCGLEPGAYRLQGNPSIDCDQKITVKCNPQGETEITSYQSAAANSDFSISSFKPGKHTIYYAGGLSNTYEAYSGEQFLFVRMYKKKYLVFNEAIGSIAFFQSGPIIDIYRNDHAEQAAVNGVFSKAYCRYQNIY